ncbi:AI-2E family transporter [Rhodobacteraceae bacterium NNCM2]|nr:AI-2E family transporter [Coraliihabitans acroporae]
MTLSEQLRYWGIGLLIALALVWLLGDTLLPFVLGAAIAYFTDPIADRLERAGLSRTMATVVITAAAVAIALIAMVLVVPVLVDQIRQMITDLPSIIEQSRMLLSKWLPTLEDDESFLRKALSSFDGQIREWSGTAISSVLSGSVAVLDFLSLVVITPVVAFYLLHDWDNMVEAIDDMLPREHRDTIHRIMGDLDRVLAGFVRGQMMVCLILGTFYAITLSLIGLSFGMLIGLFAGLISFIPFVGSIMGGILSVGVAAAQFWNEPQWILVVAAVFVAGQAIEGNYLTPKLVGDSVGLHPVWLMLALTAFGSLFGFVGLLLAVPTAAGIGVMVRFLASRYKEGRLYRGSIDWQRKLPPTKLGEGADAPQDKTD